MGCIAQLEKVIDPVLFQKVLALRRRRGYVVNIDKDGKCLIYLMGVLMATVSAKSESIVIEEPKEEDRKFGDVWHVFMKDIESLRISFVTTSQGKRADNFMDELVQDLSSKR